MSAPKEVWLSSDGILFKSVSINAYRAQVHSEDVRYVLHESAEAEAASLRAQLAEAKESYEALRRAAGWFVTAQNCRDVRAMYESLAELRRLVASAPPQEKERA